MRARHSRIPTQWLMTDERMGDALWQALEQVPAGGGVIYRHYTLERPARQALFVRIAQIARRRRLVLIVAGRDVLGRGSAGVHGRIVERTPGIKSWPAHNRREVVAGRRAGADVTLISPVFPTRSHAGVPTLGIVRAALLARQAHGRVIALGGVDESKHRQLMAAGFDGWAGIDAWLTARP